MLFCPNFAQNFIYIQLMLKDMYCLSLKVVNHFFKAILIWLFTIVKVTSKQIGRDFKLLKHILL